MIEENIQPFQDKIEMRSIAVRAQLYAFIIAELPDKIKRSPKVIFRLRTFMEEMDKRRGRTSPLGRKREGACL